MESGKSNRDKFDVFISYRRTGSAAEARSIRAALNARGFSVFLDVEELGSGYFDESLLNHIENSPNFIIILSPDSMDRCTEESDWLRRELACALRSKKNIIPVLLPGFKFPATLPQDIQDLPRHQALEYSHYYFDAMTAKILQNLRINTPRLYLKRTLFSPLPSIRWLSWLSISTASLIAAVSITIAIKRIGLTQHFPIPQPPTATMMQKSITAADQIIRPDLANHSTSAIANPIGNIDKALSAAKAKQVAARQEKIRSLNNNIERNLQPGTEEQTRLSYQILKGQLLLMALSSTTAQSRAPSDYESDALGFIENQKQLAVAIKGRKVWPFMGAKLSSADLQLAKIIGVSEPGSYTFLSSVNVLRDTAEFVLFGSFPTWMHVNTIRRVCYFRLHNGMDKMAINLFEDAIAEIPYNGRESDKADITEKKAEGYLAIGDRDKAIATYQTLLETALPPNEFATIEARIRAIANGSGSAYQCTYP